MSRKSRAIIGIVGAFAFALLALQYESFMAGFGSVLLFIWALDN